MANNRRDFLKMSAAATAALALPDLLFAAGGNTRKNNDEAVIKTFLFQGDSITDGGRSYNKDWNHVFGQDYAYLIASRLNFEYAARDYRFFNRGISGNTVADLAARWQQDALDLKPDLLSILVGVNDVFGVIVKGDRATADDFGHTYDKLLSQTLNTLPDIQLVIGEPFILPVGMVKDNPVLWNSEIAKRQSIIKQLAAKYNAVHVPLQTAFNNALIKAPADHWIWDGVHPMPAGHELIAREWLKTVNKRFKIF